MQTWAMHVLAGTGLHAWRRPVFSLPGCTCAPAPAGSAWGHPEARGVGCGGSPQASSTEGPRHESYGRGR